MPQPLIVFRTDAATRIGSGHLRRCRSLASALERLGAHTRFVLRRTDVDIGATIGDHPVVWLPAAAGRPDRNIGAHAHAGWLDAEPLVDADEFCDAAGGPVAGVVVDHYGIEAAWHERVAGRLRCPLIAIDDLADRALSVELIVDHNVSADHAVKYRAVNLRGCHVLGGPRHALLDPRFADAPRNPAAHPVRSIGIFMGGVDAAGLSIPVWRSLREITAFAGEIEVATTSANPRLPELQVLAGRDPGGRLLVDDQDLAGFFGRHELHIGAGGGATWERCCLGAPTLAVIAAPNQREVLLPLAGASVLEVLDETGCDAATIARHAARLFDQPAHRQSMSRQAMQLVDGRGAERVASRIMNLCNP